MQKQKTKNNNEDERTMAEVEDENREIEERGDRFLVLFSCAQILC